MAFVQKSHISHYNSIQFQTELVFWRIIRVNIYENKTKENANLFAIAGNNSTPVDTHDKYKRRNHAW